jgi:Dolichyl-phosphate-mannose-protein mannosyltransferase
MLKMRRNRRVDGSAHLDPCVWARASLPLWRRTQAPRLESTGSAPTPRSAGAIGSWLLAVALALGVLVGCRALSHEGAFFLAGDQPRYLINGVFLYDFLRLGAGWHARDAISWAEHYYARYPALSLGHHMPLLPVALVPFFAGFGVSVFSGRLAILTFFVLAIVLLYRLVAKIYDRTVAGWASVLFVTSPIIGSFAQRVLSEMPAIALTLAALNLIVRFRRSGRLGDYLLLIVTVAASLLARPTAAYMLPAYGILLLANGGGARLRQRAIFLTTAVGVALIVGAVVATIAFAPFNAAMVRQVLLRGVDLPAIGAVLRTISRERPLFIATLCGGAATIASRDRRGMLAAIWIASVLVCAVVLTGSIEPGRYSILAVPAYCIVAASTCASATGWRGAAASLLLVVVAGSQLVTALARPTVETPGYEAAAEYVVTLAPAPTVLYSASIDTGYFVFFVRKHDPDMRLVVLRSDKLLTTSLMGQLSIADRIEAPSDIYPLLQRFGTRFIVTEDRPSDSVVLNWLATELLTDRFIERKRFPIGDGAPELRGVSLVVYEYRDAGNPEPDAMLDFDLPLVGRRIRVPLSDLLAPPR